jgi:NADH/NAD ratio-sensing transcriptional regulator Rex
MVYRRTTKGRYYFVCIKKMDNSIIIATSKQAIATFLGVHVATVRRKLNNVMLFNCDEYIIWKNIPISLIKK